MKEKMEKLKDLLEKLDAEVITDKTPVYRDDHAFFFALGLLDEEEVRPVDFQKDIGIQFNDFAKMSENIEDVETLLELLREIKKGIRECSTCKYAYAHRDGECEGCLEPEEGETKYAFRNHVYGNPDKYRLEQERAGKINIVLGNEGEHEVNANWTIEEAKAKLYDRCNACGGVSFREGDSLFVDKTFGYAYRLVYIEGKLDHILEVRKENGIRRSKMWWTAEDIDIYTLLKDFALREIYAYNEQLDYEDPLEMNGETYMIGQLQFLFEMVK